MKGSIDVLVETDPKESWIQGRNGLYNLHKISIHGDEAIMIDGIGKRGSVINGGLHVDRAAFDELVRQISFPRSTNPEVCQECGSAEVETSVWVKINTGEEQSSCQDDPYCPVCQSETSTFFKTEYTFTIENLLKQTGWKPKAFRFSTKLHGPQYCSSRKSAAASVLINATHELYRAAGTHTQEQTWHDLPEWVTDEMIREYEARDEPFKIPKIQINEEGQRALQAIQKASLTSRHP